MAIDLQGIATKLRRARELQSLLVEIVSQETGIPPDRKKIGVRSCKPASALFCLFHPTSYRAKLGDLGDQHIFAVPGEEHLHLAPPSVRNRRDHAGSEGLMAHHHTLGQIICLQKIVLIPVYDRPLPAKYPDPGQG